MALQIRKSRELISPDKLKLKVLLVAPPGFGKTTWIANTPKPLLGVSEEGHGKGLLSVAYKDLDYVELNSYEDFDSFCSGSVLKGYETGACDSLSNVARTLVKSKALSVPRTKGESLKRTLGVPELDDYGTMGELTRKLTKKLIDQPQHVVCTATVRINAPDPEERPFQTDTMIGPDFPGSMFLGSTAMFDIVLNGRERICLRDPKDAKSRYKERYWLTENQGGFLAKNRLCVDEAGSFLPTELVYDLEKNTGTFDDIYRRAVEAYTQYFEAHKK